jgi:hypothetical protein
MAAAPSVREERLAKAVAERVTGRIMELLAIDEQLKRLQERVDQSAIGPTREPHVLPERSES